MTSMNAIPLPLAALLKQKQNDGYINTSEMTIRNHDVFIDSDIEEPAEYRDLISILFNANEGDSISIFINSGGGHMDTALAIVEGLKATSAHTTAILLGACHSAASIITMYCDEVAVTDSAYMMVHTAAGGNFGTVSNAASQAAFINRKVNVLLDDTYNGFLSKEELEKVRQGVEVWLDAEDIRTRFQSRVKYLETKAKKEEKRGRKTDQQTEGRSVDIAAWV
jgi:ATP-dependent protease ClpP protease subunit